MGLDLKAQALSHLPAVGTRHADLPAAQHQGHLLALGLHGGLNDLAVFEVQCARGDGFYQW